LPLYPPQVSILFMPLASLSYGWALALWWGCGALVYGICCYSIWQACPNLRGVGGTVLILAMAYPAFFHLIAWGQTSALALGCFTLMFFALRARREFLAGLILGCLIFKPQLGLAAAVVFVSLGAWKTVAGAVFSAVAQLAVGVLYYGMQPLREWLRALADVRAVLPWLEPRPYQTYSLRTFCSMLVPWPHFAFGLYGLSAIVVLGVTIAVWRHPVPLALRYSALLLATVLVAPHFTVYDLVILAPAFLLLADLMAGQRDNRSPHWLGTTLYLIYALPLLGPLSRWTHVQLAVIAMTACVYVVWRTGGRLARVSRSQSAESVAK
jgi:alpha-1,2-mannosyltransferase